MSVLDIVATLNHFECCPVLVFVFLFSLLSCDRREGVRRGKMALKRRNSSSSVELCLAIEDLDVQVCSKGF